MNYSAIKYCDIANGTGVRTSLFVSGCRVRCPGCFNEETWDFASGEPFDDAVAERIWKSIEPAWVDGLTVLGGEPFEPENQAALRPFLEETRRRFPGKDIWCFTGYVCDRDLLPAGGRKRTADTLALLSCVDVLVDGPFKACEHDVSLRFRGSANQRLIDIAAMRAQAEERGVSLEEVELVPWQDEEVYATHTM